MDLYFVCFILSLWFVCYAGPTPHREGLMEHIEKINNEGIQIKENLIEVDIKLREGKEERGGVVYERFRWPDAIIPYTIDSSLGDHAREVIDEAIEVYSLKTCIKWIPRTTQLSYVNFFQGSGCWSMLGQMYKERHQNISLGSGCEWKSTVLHEMMHAAGFFHTHSRYDRDEFVDIHWENIDITTIFNFFQFGPNVLDLYGPYDIRSNMHYGTKAFSTNGKPTITAKGDPDGEIYLGQPHVGGDFTQTDLDKLNEMYPCQ